MVTYKVFSMSPLTEIGICEGIPDSDRQGNFVLLPLDMHDLVNVGDCLVSPSGEYLNIYSETPVLDDNKNLVAFKLHYH